MKLLGDNKRRLTNSEVRDKIELFRQRLIIDRKFSGDTLPDLRYLHDDAANSTFSCYGAQFPIGNEEFFKNANARMASRIGKLVKEKRTECREYKNEEFSIILNKQDGNSYMEFFQFGGFTEHGLNAMLWAYEMGNSEASATDAAGSKAATTRKVHMRAADGNSDFDESNCYRQANPEEIEETFDDIAGQDEAKEGIVETVEFLKDPSRFNRLGGKMPRGILLEGPPGVGKTMFARATAKESRVPLFYMSGSDFDERLVGVGASRVRAITNAANEVGGPAIIFIDELEAMGGIRVIGEKEQTLNALLVAMDGFDKNSNVLFMAATNRADMLDPALLRPGRFTRQINFHLPNKKERLDILNVYAKKVVFSEDVNLEEVAKGIPGFSGADIANLANESAIYAAAQLNADAIEMDAINEMIDKICLGPKKKNAILSEEERWFVAVHESGHTLLAILLKHHVDMLNKVTILGRGKSSGTTHYFPEEDVHYSEENLKAWMVSVLGGRAATKILLNKNTEGCGSDLKKANQLASKMVKEMGMSELGPIFIEDLSAKPVYLQIAGSGLSEKTLQEIDVEVKRILNEANEKAETLLDSHKDVLEVLARELLEKETMDALEIYSLVNPLLKNPTEHAVAEEKRKKSQSIKL